MRRIDNIHDIDRLLQEPGRYVTTSHHQAYSVVVALANHPQVRLGQALYNPSGTIQLFEVLRESVSPNVSKLSWGTTDDYYERRLRDYDDWETAFWREIVQNSRDAGATNVALECVTDSFRDPESGEIVECTRCTATDNGRGMGFDTLMNAFFRRGGSEKPVGAVGGFGDAKNLILTPWLGYRVRTQDAVAQGRHEELFEQLTRDGQSFFPGTELTVWMPVTKSTTPAHAQFLIEQSSLDNISFTVNATKVKSTLPRGKEILREPIIVDGDKVGEVIGQYSSRAKGNGVYVRSYGIFMFEIQGYTGDFRGVVTFDINAPPINVFTTKRDQLSYNSSARETVFGQLKRLATDPKQALRAKRDKKEIVYRGSGTLDLHEGVVAEMAADILSRLDVRQTGKTPGIQLTAVTSDAIQAMFGDFFEGMVPGPVDLRPLRGTFSLASKGHGFVDVDQVVLALQLSVWQPDFFVYQNISPWKMPGALEPAVMEKKYHQLMVVWTEVCRFILIQLGIDKPFGVGWVFDSEYDYKTGDEAVIGALWRYHGGIHWLLLNPLEIEMSGSSENASFRTKRDRFRLSDLRSMEDLVSLAVHEITHMQGFPNHTDAYASALTGNIKAIFRLAPVLKKIIASARTTVRERRARLPEGTSRKSTEAARTESVIQFEWRYHREATLRQLWGSELWVRLPGTREPRSAAVVLETQLPVARPQDASWHRQESIEAMPDAEAFPFLPEMREQQQFLVSLTPQLFEDIDPLRLSRSIVVGQANTKSMAVNIARTTVQALVGLKGARAKLVLDMLSQGGVGIIWAEGGPDYWTGWIEGQGTHDDTTSVVAVEAKSWLQQPFIANWRPYQGRTAEWQAIGPFMEAEFFGDDLETEKKRAEIFFWQHVEAMFAEPIDWEPLEK